MQFVPARPQPVSVGCRAPGRPCSSQARVGRSTSGRPALTAGRMRPGSPVDELPNAAGRSPPPPAAGVDRRPAVRPAFLSGGAPPRRRRQGLTEIDGRGADPDGPKGGHGSRWRSAAHQPGWPKRESSALLPSCPPLRPPSQASCGVSSRRPHHLPRYRALTPSAGRLAPHRVSGQEDQPAGRQAARWRILDGLGLIGATQPLN
jgi:hypothetical protein